MGRKAPVAALIYRPRNQTKYMVGLYYFWCSQTYKPIYERYCGKTAHTG